MDRYFTLSCGTKLHDILIRQWKLTISSDRMQHSLDFRLTGQNPAVGGRSRDPEAELNRDCDSTTTRNPYCKHTLHLLPDSTALFLPTNHKLLAPALVCTYFTRPPLHFPISSSTVSPPTIVIAHKSIIQIAPRRAVIRIPSESARISRPSLLCSSLVSCK